MAEYGEWNRKGAALSEVTAEKEYGVTRDFIVKGIQDGKLEYRDGAVWGNPYLKVLRSQLELYIVAQLGSEYLVSKKSQTELRAISKEIADLRKKLAALDARKTALEREIKTWRPE
jgi:septal ring factor EnvC (AmiA/AmiB activator)